MTIVVTWTLQGVSSPEPPPITITINADACASLEQYRQSVTTQQPQKDPDTGAITYASTPTYPDVLSMVIDKMKTGILQPAFRMFPPPQVQAAIVAAQQAQQEADAFVQSAIVTA